MHGETVKQRASVSLTK